MPSNHLVHLLGLAGLVAAIPAPQVAGYVDANWPFTTTPVPLGTLASKFGPDSLIDATTTSPPRGSMAGAAPPNVVSNPTGHTSHGPYNGAPTTTGALKNTILAASIDPLPLNPTATYYNPQGVLLEAQPAPYTPNGR
jgi:hypothetical protein